ncbi:helix-turn-helix domain-containing protein [Paenibacillus sp. TRM 82003]|nr:helix-turn-helix domain-containing protein [Paenibacillus sp. TRM 82003]
MKELGRTLRKLRGNRSLRDIAEISGISHTYIKVLEDAFNPRDGNVPEPTPSTLRKLSVAYEHPYSELMRCAGYLDGIEMTGSKGSSDLEKLKEQNQALRNSLRSLLDSMM